jgi:hypothetical protein
MPWRSCWAELSWNLEEWTACVGPRMEAYVHGTSTRTVDDLVAALGVESGISKSEVSRICADLDAEVSAFNTRDLSAQAFPYVFLDATYCKARIGGDKAGKGSKVASQAVVIATGVAADGRREVLGCAVGDSETEAFWAEFLRGLRERGLAGVQLVISDHHRGLRNAIDAVLLGAALATLPGALHVQRAGQGAQGISGDGRRRGAHHLRPAHRRAGAHPGRTGRGHPGHPVPAGRRDVARCHRADHRLRRLPRGALAKNGSTAMNVGDLMCGREARG